MPKRAVAMLLAVVLFVTGCYTKKIVQVPGANPVQAAKDKITGVTTLQGQDIAFDEPGGTIANGTVSGKQKGAAVSFGTDQVQRYWVERKQLSTARTIGLVAAVTVGTVLVLGAIIATTKQSCPFVYSWDGEKYVFDAEPYGGAISKGLEKDDFEELGKLKEQDGLYKLHMTNEVDETQMTNLTELWVADHAPGTRVVPDIQGKLHTVAGAQAPLSARDAGGKDLLPWLRATDQLIYEPAAVVDEKGGLQGDIVISFPKPAGATQVKLVANAATGLWGSYMIKKMVELRGREVGAWYKTIDESQSARDDLFAWEVREEIYALKVYVEEPTGWEVRGILPGTGPFISKDRILPLDVSRVKGDTLRIRIHPPAGFWALNSFAVDYSADQPVTFQRLAPATARDRQGKDVLPDLLSVDDRYYAMPNMGDTADLTFKAPPTRAGMERAVFLHSRGYYKLHVNESGEPDVKTLTALENEPGTAARFAANQFGQWQMARQQK